jgi:hypothetical protein
MIKKLIIRFARWLIRICGPSPYLKRAIELCKEQQIERPNATGENKRHQVMSRLIKEFPTASHRELSRAIEDAI